MLGATGRRVVGDHPCKGIWGCWSTAGSVWVSTELWQPRGQSPSWDASNTATPAGQKRWWIHSIQHWCSLTWVLCAVLPQVKRMWKSLNVATGGQQRGCKRWKQCPIKSGEGLWACLVWRERGWGGKKSLYGFLRRRTRKGVDAILSLAPSNRMHGNGPKLCQRRFRLDTRNNFFTKKVFKH